MTSATLNLLKAEKLTEENYTTWKITICTVLVIDDLKFILTEECPPGTNVSQNIHDAYDRWIKANDKPKVYILVGLTEVLIKKNETMTIAHEIMESLHDMFGKPSSQAMHDALKVHLQCTDGRRIIC
ncbi:uncharacterized protein LOC120076068 [Benincasa hispida]|uniref:uncharacterized protein LOC120076068 n=1 Tax=Benincasa hispida TaxID=102211 RepID=UPI0018FF3E48|nr:uncharacterized protein LOC120076068 [Benincasa hispida]